MAKIINFDELKRLHDLARVGGTGSKAWIEFVTTMVEFFPALYETAKAMNAESTKLRWQSIETAPRDTVVDLFVPCPSNEAGFKGFRYTGCYMTKSGEWTSKNFDSELQRTIKQPSHWMPLPAPPETVM